MNIEGIISEMNKSIPINRRSLRDYLDNGNLVFVTRDGVKCSFDREELELLDSKCTELEKIKLKLPIFVSTDISYAGGAWKVEGNTEATIVSRILEKKIYKEDMLRLYHSDLKYIRKLFPNVVVMLFLP